MQIFGIVKIIQFLTYYLYFCIESECVCQGYISVDLCMYVVG